MRRSMMVFAAVLVVLTMTLTIAAAVTLSQRDGASGHRMGHAPMMADPGSGGGWGPDGRAGMHGPVVDSEFAYLAEMVAHHEEAVSAAGELRRSERAAMREFGAAVVRTQSAQIDQMRAWLAEWYPNRSTDVEYQPMMRDLTELSGDRLDRAFLRDMIPHHMAAVMMSQQLLMRDLATHPQVNRLAAAIRDEQHAEIFQMSRWLRDWFGAGWPHRGGAGMGWGMHGSMMGR